MSPEKGTQLRTRRIISSLPRHNDSTLVTKCHSCMRNTGVREVFISHFYTQPVTLSLYQVLSLLLHIIDDSLEHLTTQRHLQRETTVVTVWSGTMNWLCEQSVCQAPDWPTTTSPTICAPTLEGCGPRQLCRVFSVKIKSGGGGGE
jgi:hypothetical protein